MRVFLSWSGERSLRVAEALRDWLPSILQSVEPWLSSADVSAGARWVTEITEALQSSTVGILCLTPDNITSAWLNFEAGAISRSTGSSLVCLYGVGVSPTELKGPLAQFQYTRAEREDTFRLIRALNQANPSDQLADDRLARAFEIWWPQLEAQLADLVGHEPPVAIREATTVDAKLDVILEQLSSIQSGRRVLVQEAPGPLEPTAAGRRPRVFIGSSSEGLPIAQVVQLGLDQVAECTIWNQGAFDLSSTFIESIVDASAQYDFAVIVLTADDMVEKRGEVGAAPRDNILFELGLFTGALGRARTFLVQNREEKIRLPSDLDGVTIAEFTPHSDGNLEAALGSVCTRIQRAMGRLGTAS